MAKRKYLKKEEMLEIDLLNERIKSKNYEIEVMKYRAREMTFAIEKMAAERQNIKDLLKKQTDALKNEFKVTGDSFGYDPITGEVIHD